jgi:hypothetical protein
LICIIRRDYAASLLAGGHVLVVCGCNSDPDATALRCPRYRQGEDVSSVFFQLHVAGAVLVLGGALTFARLRLREAKAAAAAAVSVDDRGSRK